jgi:ElaB/YqjD/DUF883 family membrane-anchored ribosome-binding protein
VKKDFMQVTKQLEAAKTSETKPELAELRDSVTAKLGELHRRATQARIALSPSNYLRQPWLRIGLGVAIGYAIGRRAFPTSAGAHETIGHAVVRAGLSAAVTMLVAGALKPAVPTE